MNKAHWGNNIYFHEKLLSASVILQENTRPKSVERIWVKDDWESFIFAAEEQ